VIDKPGKGSFYATDLDLILHTKGVSNIVLCGVTTDVCVHTTMRDANDRGYECLILSDCVGATDPSNHEAALKMVKMQGGVFGAVASSEQFIAGILPKPDLAGASIPPACSPPVAKAKTSAEVQLQACPSPVVLPLSSTALIMIDFQRDFMYPGGFGAALGNEVERLQQCLPGAQKLLAAARSAGLLVVHTLEAHKPDLSDCPPAKLQRSGSKAGHRIGDEGGMGRILIRGEHGNGIVDEVAPVQGEVLLWKPGKGAFYNTELQSLLAARGITHLLFSGVTTDVCVQTSMREANDRGYECVLVEDATESYFPSFKENTIAMLTAQGGIVGRTTTSDSVAKAVSVCTPEI